MVAIQVQYYSMFFFSDYTVHLENTSISCGERGYNFKSKTFGVLTISDEPSKSKLLDQCFSSLAAY